MHRKLGADGKGGAASVARPRLEDGGEEEIRTLDPRVANAMLYQLSYFPKGLKDDMKYSVRLQTNLFGFKKTGRGGGESAIIS